MFLVPAVTILFILALVFFIWIFPLIIIGTSNRVSNNEKLAWMLAVIFISWFAWIIFLLVAPLKKD